MNILTFPAPIFIKKFEQHEKYKKDLLHIIDSIDNDSYLRENVRTDFFDNTNITRPYFDLIKDDIGNHFEEIINYLTLDDFDVASVWFQQYNKSQFHNFHIHKHCSWNNVYYVEFEKGNPGTTFLNVLDGRGLTPRVEEGDIITFPSFIKHCSVSNESNSRKTVIAFNVN